MNPSHDDVLSELCCLADAAHDLSCDASELAGYDWRNDWSFDDDRDGHGAGIALAWELGRIADRLRELSEIAWLREAARAAAEMDREETP